MPRGDGTDPLAVQVLEDTMNANDTLTGTGTVTFTCSINSDRKLVIAADTGNIDYTHSTSDGGITWGFSQDATAASSITADNPIA